MIDRSLNYGRHCIEEFMSKVDSPSTVLDIGAGHGADLAYAYKKFPNANLVGLENWPQYINELSNKGISVLSLNIEKDKLPFNNESLDLIIANQILEHCKEVFWIFSEISRVLKVGGNFILGVPNLASLHNRILLAFGRHPSPIKTASAHVRGYTRHDLENFLSTCFPEGYRLVSFKGSNFYPFPPFLAKLLAKVLPNFAWGIFLLLQKVRPYNDEFLKFPREQRLETNYFTGEK
jgi:SAM-dependent methyltransferase